MNLQICTSSRKVIKNPKTYWTAPKKLDIIWGYFYKKKLKYDYAFKHECPKVVLEKHYSDNYVSNQKGSNESNIRKCVEFYKHYGGISLLPRKNQNYSLDFKL